jgi:serine/threonine protein kinase
MEDFSKWKQLKHDRILPVYGISYGFGPVLSIVFPWMHNGSLSAYLDKHYDDFTGTQKFGLVSLVSNKPHDSSRLLSQLADVAAGLQYRTSCQLPTHRDKLILVHGA